MEFYAEQLYITSNYLNKIVRQSLGVSTKQYLSQLLYQEAEILLRYTSMTINEIAMELNLDTAYFIKKFKQVKNATPLQYRNQSNEGLFLLFVLSYNASLFVVPTIDWLFCEKQNGMIKSYGKLQIIVAFGFF